MEKLKKVKKKIIELLKDPMIYVMIFCIVMQILVYRTLPDYIMQNDSYTYDYTNKYKANILKGEVDQFRTPIYPNLIKIIGKIGGEETLHQNIALFQKILFVFSMIMFYDLLKKITNNKVITSVIAIVFGTCPFIIFWNVFILTEALSVFEIILLSWITIEYLRNPNKILASMMRNSYISYDYD